MTEAAAQHSETQRSGFELEDTFIWRLKVRLQFTGWLQYVPTAILGLVFLLIAGVGWLIGVWPGLLFWTPLSIGLLLSTNAAFEVVTLISTFGRSLQKVVIDAPAWAWRRAGSARVPIRRASWRSRATASIPKEITSSVSVQSATSPCWGPCSSGSYCARSIGGIRSTSCSSATLG